MLMRTRNETLYKHPDCHANDNIKPGKWEREYYEEFSLRCPTADCDTKRSGPCKEQADCKK